MGRKRTGAIEPRGGKYYARVGRDRLGAYDTEAAAARAIAIHLHVEGESRKDSRTLAVLGTSYMEAEEVLTRARRGDAVVFCNRDWPLWRRWICTAKFWRKDVDKITRDDVRDLLDAIVGAPAMRFNVKTKTYYPTGEIIGTRTAEAVRSRLVHFFNQCRGLKHNAAKGVPIRNIQRIKRKLDGDAVPHLHLDEIERLYALPLDLFTLKHRAIYALGIYTGLRGGEIVGLEWPSIVRLYGERPEIHVRSSYNLLTKTQSSQREVPMLPQPVQHLQAYCDSLGARPITGLVFPNPFGGHYARGWSAGWYTTDRKDYRPRKTAVRFQKRGTRSDVGFRELAKIRDHILYKHLRHTCATQLRAGHFTADRWSADMVARLLGHTDVKMQSHYVSSGVADLHEYLETNKPKVIG